MGTVENSLVLRKKAKRATRAVAINLKYVWIGYILSILAATLFALAGWVDNSYARSGALLIFFATGISGIHFYHYLKVNSFFEENDSDYGAWGIGRPAEHPKQYDTREKIVIGQTQYLIRKCNEVVQKKLSRFLNLVVIWETILLATGTLVWGFADLLGGAKCST